MKTGERSDKSLTATQSPIGRFAPSPTGRMHAGNIASYLLAWLSAKSQGGTIVLRIEDVDEERSRPEFASHIMHDLDRLGLTWDGDVLYQSRRTDLYEEIFQDLLKRDVVYECFCSRKEACALSKTEGGEVGYTGACRTLTDEERFSKREMSERLERNWSWRCGVEERAYDFDDIFLGRQQPLLQPGFDDFIVKRSDGLFAYQLAVVADDAASGITEIIRGGDLLLSVAKQRYLQEVLGYETPAYGHVPLFIDASGRKLSKRNNDAFIEPLLKRFGSSERLIGHIAFLLGLLEVEEAATPEDLLAVYDTERMRERLSSKSTILFH